MKPINKDFEDNFMKNITQVDRSQVRMEMDQVVY